MAEAVQKEFEARYRSEHGGYSVPRFYQAEEAEATICNGSCQVSNLTGEFSTFGDQR